MFKSPKKDGLKLMTSDSTSRRQERRENRLKISRRKEIIKIRNQ